MSLRETLGLRALHLLDAESAHGLSIRALQLGLAPLPAPFADPVLKTNLAGITLDTPVGLAAGYDKNAEVLMPLSRAGFGFVEVGAATPRAQPGNPKPRLFRLTKDRAAINRFGFNNQGMEKIAQRLAAYDGAVPIGLNLGANKDSDDKARDFCRVLEACGAHVQFATVNVSSPNTEKLRDLQGREALQALMAAVDETRRAMPVPIPIFLKIAPDLSPAEIEDIASVAQATHVDAIIATNTTLAREGLTSAHSGQAGGLSGAPLFEAATRVLARLSTLTDIPLVGVGGVGSADQAYAKIRAGASAVQLYTALVYGGLSLVREINEGLAARLRADGFTNLAEAVGTDRDPWL